MRLIMYLLAVALLIAGSAMATHAVVQDEGLILYFSFDAEEDGFVVDETGGRNDGLITGAEIATDEVVHGKGSLLCDANGDGVTVESFKALEEYQDNSYLFWLNFIVANSGGWDQIIAKKAPGSDRSPGIWTCNRVSLHIHYRFNPGNAGSLCVGPEGEGTNLALGTGTTSPVSKKATNSSSTLMVKWLMNRLFQQVTHKEQRNCISVKQGITLRSSTWMISMSMIEPLVLLRSQILWRVTSPLLNRKANSPRRGDS